MKVKVDREHKVVIANGGFEGKKIVVKAICGQNDEFDEAFGVELATRKFEIKKSYAKMRKFERMATEYRKLYRWAKKQCESYESFAENTESKMKNQIVECNCFVDEYYEKNK